MADLIDLNGNWIGKMKYGESFGEHKDKELTFSMIIQSQDGELTGSVTDLEGFGACPEEALIEGFIEDDLISFIKKFPVCYEFNENWELVKIEEKAPTEINFSGNYNAETGKFAGEWDMFFKSEPVGLGYIDLSVTGEWEIEKEKDSSS